MAHLRPRGYIDWKPHNATLALIEAVQTILSEYVPTYGPMTLRQIFYRLVASVAFPKTELAYGKLSNHVTSARRAQLIPFEHIRDDGNITQEPSGWQSADSFIRVVRTWATEFTLRRDIGQPSRTIILVEAGGMVPQVARVADQYGVTVMSAGGFDGLSGKHDLAEDVIHAFRNRGRPTRLLHIGDHDPSGVHIYSSLVEDIAAFVDDKVDADVAFFPERIALLPSQIIEFDLPTAPAKAGDNRSFAGVAGDPTATVQCEALTPSQSAEIVEAAILMGWNADKAAELGEQEESERERLLAWVS